MTAQTAVPADAPRPGPAPADRSVPERLRQAALLLVFALVPLTFVGAAAGGFALAGLAWVVAALVVTPLAVTQPLEPQVLRRAAPYLLFLFLAVLGLAVATQARLAVAGLAQLTAPLPAFLLAASLHDRAAFVRRAAALCQAGIALSVVVTLATVVGVLPPELLSTRPMGIALVGLFVVGSLTASPARAAVLGLAAFSVSAGTGGRTASAVLLVVLVFNPAFRLTWRGRTVLALTGIATVVALSQTAAFQERFFFGGSGTLSDALTGGESLNTAGRRELWPRLVDDCSVAPLLGRGVGTGSLTSSDLTLGVLRQPHDDYLRTYCDVGLLGAVPFWAFFVAAGVSGLRLARRGDPLGQASAAVVLALLLLAVTDNPIIYTAHFMLPVGVVLGLAARADVDRQPRELPAS